MPTSKPTLKEKRYISIQYNTEAFLFFKQMEEILSGIPEEYHESTTISIESYADCDDSYEYNFDFIISWERGETLEEKRQREKLIMDQQSAHEREERELYERLRNKYKNLGIE